MKVFVVTEEHGEDAYVFSTAEKAEAYAIANPYNTYVVGEVTVDDDGSEEDWDEEE